MHTVLEKIQEIGIVPVVVLDDVKDAMPLAQALCEGGLPCAEVTFRTPAAEESIRIMSEEFPRMLVGAGTVLTTEQVDRAVAAGAKFIVSPGLNPRIVKYCVEKGIPITPGCSSASVKNASTKKTCGRASGSPGRLRPRRPRPPRSGADPPPPPVPRKHSASRSLPDRADRPISPRMAPPVLADSKSPVPATVDCPAQSLRNEVASPHDDQISHPQGCQGF